MRRFGAGRRGARAHAGCDLYAPEGTSIHAVADGVVTRAPYEFYAQTHALEVDHGGFLVRYGEVMKGNGLREGDRVEKGQPIAKVGHLVGLTLPSDMLHIEFYDKTAAGSLTQGKATSARHTNGWSFRRRRDLVDPTPFLNRWQTSPPA
jgi:murein DD-endopeptidase MepM/ murein hydrolase activator NlpD